MDSTAVNINVTIDDWASLWTYHDITVWQTPDPTVPGFYNSTSPWVDNTYHKTSAVNESVKLDFIGPAIYVYGASGPTSGSYLITVDGYSTTHSAHATANASEPYLLYGNSSLPYANHTLVIQNLGAAQPSDGGGQELLLDFALATAQLAPSGATVTNSTIEDSDPRVQYSGSWTSESGPLFSGGTTIYTNTSSSATLKFNGSALYIFGDTVNDHGPFSVAIDGNPSTIYYSGKGCGGALAKVCEKTTSSLQYFTSNLGEGEHTAVLTNVPGNNGVYFDLDSFVYTTPSVYTPRSLEPINSTSTVSGPSQSTGSAKSGSSRTASWKTGTLLVTMMLGSLLGLVTPLL